MNELDNLNIQAETSAEELDNQSISKKKYLPGGGMYRNVKMPVKVLNYGIVIGMLALVVTIIILASKGGFKVNFNTEGGSTVALQIIKHGETATEPSAPTKIGYNFDGWYSDENYTKIWNFQKDEIVDNTTLYAKWTPITVKVSFDLAGGTYMGSDKIAPIKVTFGEKYGESLPLPQRSGYSFSGWYYNGANVTGDTLVSMNGEHTLTATWTKQ